MSAAFFYLQAWAIFLASRLLMAAATWYGIHYAPQTQPGFWHAAHAWCPYLLRFDSAWYVRILREGYSFNGNAAEQQKVAFFPLYPLLARLAKTLFGLDEFNAALLVANLFIILAIPLFARLVRPDYGAQVALYAVAFLSFFPTALFFSAGYTESLAFLLIISFFLALRDGHLTLAAACAGCALATRPVCFVLLLPLGWELLRRYRTDWPRLVLRGAVCGLLATSGLWLYMLFLGAAFGRPRAFAENLQAWEQGTSHSLSHALLLKPFFQVLPELFRHGPVPNIIDPWLWLIFLAVLLAGRRHITPALFIYGLAGILFPYLTRSGGALEFQSMLRYFAPRIL